MNKKQDDTQLVWSSEQGDLRKKKVVEKKSSNDLIAPNTILQLRRVTSGKGRPVIEITGLPNNDDWCKKLSQELKSHLASGGTYKQDMIEIHGEQLDKLTSYLDKKSIKWKKIGG